MGCSFGDACRSIVWDLGSSRSFRAVRNSIMLRPFQWPSKKIRSCPTYTYYSTLFLTGFLMRHPPFFPIRAAALLVCAVLSNSAAASVFQMKVVKQGLTVAVAPSTPGPAQPTPTPVAAPQWAFSGSGAFAATTVNRTSAALTIQATNTGNASGVPDLVLTGPHATEFHISSNGCNVSVAPTASCDVDLRFTPGATGNRSATLSADKAVLTLSGEGKAPDPADAKVVMLLSMDNTQFTDTKGHAIFAQNVTSSAGKFGGAASFAGVRASYMTSPNSVDFGFGMQDFTMEAWVNTSTGGNIVSLRTDGSSVYYSNVMRINGGKLEWSNGQAWHPGKLSVPANSWAHVAVSRQSGKLRLFVNGVFDTEYNNTTDLGAARMAWIGVLEDGVIPFNGAIDDLRLTKGVARYTASFAVPIAPASY